jgi:penicillin-binding protein 2
MYASSRTKNNAQTNRTVGRSAQSIILMAILSVLMLGGLGSRLAYLQLFQGNRNFQKAEDNRIRLIAKPPERGRIFDRDGKVLASSRVTYAVFVWPMKAKDKNWPQRRQRLAQILNIKDQDIQTKLEQGALDNTTSYRVRIARSVGVKEVIAIEELRRELDGVEVDAETVRFYPAGRLAAHVLGYTGEMTVDELKEYKKKYPEPKDETKLDDWRMRRYRSGDIIGLAGIEKHFEDDLRGGWGGQQVEVDATGKIMKVLGERPVIKGKDVTLTIDLDLQKVAEESLGDSQGAIIAMDARNGEILAMTSRPAYDPNVFSKPITQKVWNSLNTPDAPLVNRALRAFPPASTFKIVTTTTGLESGKFSPDTVLQTYPYLVIGGVQFADWNNAGFGPLNFQGALKHSSDTFFYQIARSMPEGKQQISWSRKYGFGEHTGIELQEDEDKGLVPDAAWKKKYTDIEWSVGDSVNMSIGQGFMLATPLQVAVMFGVPASGGYRLHPHLHKENKDAKTWRQSVNLKPDTIRVIREGLRAVVADGTGHAFDSPLIPEASGKTGTAEDPPRASHTWFGGYAPAKDPEIIVVAFAENSGGGGGKICAPRARRVAEAYFLKKAGKLNMLAPLEPKK